MKPEKTPGFDSNWERIRRVLQYMSNDAYTPDVPIKYQPGDITVCRGSVENAFYYTLMDLGINLRQSERTRYLGLTNPPFRYCIINRHINHNEYEVFLLTTFGGAKHLQNLDAVARNFALPMGLTRWPTNIAPIQTRPYTFGQHTSSFLFAMPTEQEVLPREVTARVPLEELRRIRAFAKNARQLLVRENSAIRESLASRRSGHMSFTGDEANTFTLAPENKYNPALDDDIVNYGPFVKPYSSAFRVSKSRGIKLDIQAKSNFRWILQHYRQDITFASRYLSRTLHFKRSQLSLPTPYYAKCLRISLQKLMRLI